MIRALEQAKWMKRGFKQVWDLVVDRKKIANIPFSIDSYVKLTTRSGRVRRFSFAVSNFSVFITRRMLFLLLVVNVLFFRRYREPTSVVFPSELRTMTRWIGFSFYLDFSCFSSDRSVVSVAVPVGGREDTEGDRNAGVKVQIDWSRSVLS